MTLPDADAPHAPEIFDPHRRTFIQTSLAAGFALAVQPISAQTISTDSTGLVSGEVKIPSGKDLIPAYRALPAGKKDVPVVLVIQEIFGVHEHIKDVCRRFAKQGYLAIAPELFFRQGDVSRMTDIQRIRTEVVSKVPDKQVMADLDATLKWAVESAPGHKEKHSITGFCWGGRIVWLYAAHRPELEAGVAWYGRLASPATELQPQHPVDVAVRLKVPVFGLYGGKDEGIPLDTVEQMRKALIAAGNKTSEIFVFPEAPHAFFADYRPTYRESAAREGWQKALDWFKRHGASPA